jgi:hypothetical protein
MFAEIPLPDPNDYAETLAGFASGAGTVESSASIRGSHSSRRDQDRHREPDAELLEEQHRPIGA